MFILYPVYTYIRYIFYSTGQQHKHRWGTSQFSCYIACQVQQVTWMCSSVKKKSKGLWVSILYLSPFVSNKTIFDIVLMEVIFNWI